MQIGSCTDRSGDAMVDLHSTSSTPAQQPTARTELPSATDRGTDAPREWGLVGRYLPDPSLRYTKVAFAGPTFPRVVAMTLASFVAVAMVVVPLVQLAATRAPSWWTLAVVPGVALCLELWRPLRARWHELRHKLPFWWAIRTVDIGLERAVPQPGTLLRYEIHLTARRPIELQSLQVRLVFWEGWLARTRLRWLRIPYRTTEKIGHDLSRHQVHSLRVPKGEHAVVRGALPVPLGRPSEHHRGKTKHLSYLNVTVTLSTGRAGLETHRGNCPHLITFPWI